MTEGSLFPYKKTGEKFVFSPADSLSMFLKYLGCFCPDKLEQGRSAELCFCKVLLSPKPFLFPFFIPFTKKVVSLFRNEITRLPSLVLCQVSFLIVGLEKHCKIITKMERKMSDGAHTSTDEPGQDFCVRLDRFFVCVEIQRVRARCSSLTA
jgi:hypothetical protein